MSISAPAMMAPFAREMADEDPKEVKPWTAYLINHEMLKLLGIAIGPVLLALYLGTFFSTPLFVLQIITTAVLFVLHLLVMYFWSIVGCTLALVLQKVILSDRHALVLLVLATVVLPPVPFVAGTFLYLTLKSARSREDKVFMVLVASCFTTVVGALVGLTATTEALF